MCLLLLFFPFKLIGWHEDTHSSSCFFQSFLFFSNAIKLASNRPQNTHTLTTLLLLFVCLVFSVSCKRPATKCARSRACTASTRARVGTSGCSATAHSARSASTPCVRERSRVGLHRSEERPCQPPLHEIEPLRPLWMSIDRKKQSRPRP